MPNPAERAAQRRGQQLLFVALAFAALLTYPLLGVWEGGRVLGLPGQWVAMLALWAGLIALTGWLVRHPAAPTPPEVPAPTGGRDATPPATTTQAPTHP